VAYQAGSAQVSITPSFEDFHKKIGAELDTLDAQFAKAGDSSGRSFADSFQAQLKGSFANLPDAKVKADADTTAADAKLDELTKKPRTVTVKVVADKVSGKTGGLTDLLNPVAGGIAAGVALGPQALGLGAGLAGIGTAFAAAGADAAGFGVIAKGMFSDVSKAQQDLTKAQDAYNKATTDKGRAAALAAEQKALAGLTPAERDLATQLTALEGAWKKLSQAEQPVVGAAITPWLQTATSGMQLLDPVIQDGANAIQLLGSEAKTALADPFWGTFFNTLGTTGQIALTNFGEAAGKVADGVAHLFVAFAPDIDKLPPLVNDLAGAFDKWAQSVTSKGLDDFLSKTFSPSNLALLAKDGKSLGDLVTNIAKASGDMSPLAFDGLSNVLTILGSLPPGVIEAATALFLAAKTIGSISAGVGAISTVLNGIKGLFGGAATTAETAAEGTAAGTAGGTAAATAFTTAFSTEIAASLPTAFTAIGTEVAAAADAAGTVWGTAAATTFGTAFGTESATALTASFTAEDAAFTTEAGAAGTAMGTAMATALTASFDAEGVAELGGSLTAGAVGAAIGAGIAGAAIGAALGTGFTVALAATGVGGAVGNIKNDVTSAASGANTWLQPAGQQAGEGFVNGLNSERAAAQAAAAALRSSVTAGTNGSQSWIQPAGQQTGTGFDTGLNSLHGKINATAASIRNWVTSALPSPASWLVNAGVSVVQGFANAIASSTGLVTSAVSAIASAVKSGLHGIGIPGFASGTPSAPPGWFWVGEKGPELMHFAGGEQVLTHSASMAKAQSMSALSALGVPSIGSPARLPGVSAPLSAQPLQLQVSYAGTGNALTDAVVGSLRFDIQHNAGGDVQAHLGQGPVRVS
jgi:hypothetical protein